MATHIPSFDLSKPISTTVRIVSLAPEALNLVAPISVVVEPDGDEFSATFSEANINATGDSEAEAVENLKETLISAFRRYRALGEGKLGPGPRRQLAVLNSLIQCQ